MRPLGCRTANGGNLVVSATVWRFGVGTGAAYATSFPVSSVVSGRLRPGSRRKGTKMKTFLNMLRDESGASAAEYALILAIVGAGIAVAAAGLGGAIKTSMDDAKDCIETPPKAGDATC